MKLTMRVVGNTPHAFLVAEEPKKAHQITLRAETGAELNFVTDDGELAKKYTAAATVEVTLTDPVPPAKIDVKADAPAE